MSFLSLALIFLSFCLILLQGIMSFMFFFLFLLLGWFSWCFFNRHDAAREQWRTRRLLCILSLGSFFLRICFNSKFICRQSFCVTKS
jgi:putative Mn2+ efflux pump MntP